MKKAKKVHYLTLRLNHGTKERAEKLAKERQQTISTFARNCMECCLGMEEYSHFYCGQTCAKSIKHQTISSACPGKRSK